MSMLMVLSITGLRKVSETELVLPAVVLIKEPSFCHKSGSESRSVASSMVGAVLEILGRNWKHNGGQK